MAKNSPIKPAIDPSKNGESPKLQAIRLAMEQIEKQYGRGSIMKFGQAAEKFEMDVIPTGATALDLALGIGGLPKGRII